MSKEKASQKGKNKARKFMINQVDSVSHGKLNI